jgi:Na+/proline symporter
MSPVVGVVFILGLIAAAYSSADSALTALTTSFSVDILRIEKKYPMDKQNSIRKRVHIMVSFVVFLGILGFRLINDESVISAIFTVAGYTYGPLLGLYAFGLFTKYRIYDKWVPSVAILSPVLSYLIKMGVKSWFEWEIGFELLILNGLITFLGLALLTIPAARQRSAEQQS